MALQNDRCLAVPDRVTVILDPTDASFPNGEEEEEARCSKASRPSDNPT